MPAFGRGLGALLHQDTGPHRPRAARASSARMQRPRRKSWTSAEKSMKPLSRLTVVDLTVNVPGPFCSMILADMGARAIKVEPPGGDPLRHGHGMWASLNRGKQSIVLDLKMEQGRAALGKLVTTADTWAFRRWSRGGPGPYQYWCRTWPRTCMSRARPVGEGGEAKLGRSR